MKAVQGASTVENTSLKSAITILDTVVNDYTDYKDQILSNEATEKISEKTSLKLEQPEYCTQKLSREGLLLSITLSVWEVKFQIAMNTKTKCLLHRAN